MAARKPIARETSKETVKTIRAGNAGTYPAKLAATTRVFSFHAKLWASQTSGIPCAL
jgi:hypothetical protein